MQSTELQRVSWQENLPVKLMVHQSVPREGYPVIEEAIRHWNRVLGKEAFEVTIWGVGGSATPQQDGNNIVYFLDSWEQDRQSEQGRTTIYWTGARIYEADIRINGKFRMAYSPLEENFVGVDFESLMVHELGHVLGLAHNSHEESVMQVELASGSKRREPSDADVHSLQCEYL